MVERRERTRYQSLLMEMRIHDMTTRLRETRRDMGFKDESEGLFTVVKKVKKEKEFPMVTKGLSTRKADTSLSVHDDRSVLDVQQLQKYINTEIHRREMDDREFEDATEVCPFLRCYDFMSRIPTFHSLAHRKKHLIKVLLQFSLIKSN